MRRATLALLILVILAACGDEPPEPPEVADITELRVVKVSGDQEAQVPPPSASILPAAVVGEDGYTDEPLVALVEDVSPSGSLVGPSPAVVPAGTDVHWHIEDGCGHLFGQTTETDDSSHVVNRWAPGTVAGPCAASAGRLIGDSIVTDATWELVQLPGPVDRFQMERVGAVRPGDSIDIRPLIRQPRDAHGNAIPVEEVRALDPLNMIWWAWADSIPNWVSGWVATVPDTVGFPNHIFTYASFAGGGEPDWVADRTGKAVSGNYNYTYEFDVTVDPDNDQPLLVKAWAKHPGTGWAVNGNINVYSSAPDRQMTIALTDIADGTAFGLSAAAGVSISNARVYWYAAAGEEFAVFVDGAGGEPTRHSGRTYELTLRVGIGNSQTAGTAAHLIFCEGGEPPPAGGTCSDAH